MKSFISCISTLQSDLNAYRSYVSGTEKVALWPKKLSKEEI